MNAHDQPYKQSALLGAAVRFSCEQYRQMRKLGLVSEDTELLDGLVIHKTRETPVKASLLETVVSRLEARGRDGLLFRYGQTLRVDRSELRPDLAVIDGTDRVYRVSSPTTAFLIIEIGIVADIDRSKAGVYASADVDEYWIIMPAEKSVEVYSRPGDHRYEECQVYSEGQSVHSTTMPEIWMDAATLFETV